ncbi:hypothetical protein BV898_01526 [Hypsibius exemplaris]|uniref:Uncharacterized protein n=1 Tax=Hypsibius exemplaris TaxID=2072580 RepID=A0A1W0XAX2_HYPEX|nr:hypothetical protein BV898_01526 [Hypsibius exemplaris]
MLSFPVILHEVQTTPRNIEFNNARSPLLSRRTRSASQESQTSARGLLLQRQANLSGLFTGDSREHKNSSSGDIESARLLSAYDDDTLPDNFVPPLGALVERRKSRLRWDETAGVMPDAVMIRNSGRRASFHADSITPEHRITFHMPSTMGGSEVRLKASDSVNEEPENEAAAEEEEDAKVDGNRVGGVKLRDDNRGDEQEEEEEEHHTEMYKKFRPPTPRVPSLKELGHTSPEKKAKVAAKKKPPPVPVVARVRDTTMNKRAREEKQWEKKQREDKQREDRQREDRQREDKQREDKQREQKQVDNKWREDRTVVRTSPDQTVPVALKNLTTTMKRFSNAMALPHRDNGLPAMPAKFISSFNNTILDLAPRSVIVKYLDQLDRMSKKGTRYNEPVVLSRLIPKYQRDMESTGRPNPAIRDRRSLLTEIRSFNEWGQYLIEQLTNAVAPLNDLMVDGKISTEGSRIGSGASKSGTDNTLPDIDQSSTTGSSSTKGSPFFGSPLRPSSRNMGSMEAINGSPMVPRTNRAMTKSGSPKLATQSTADKDGLNKLPSLQHPFPWR